MIRSDVIGFYWQSCKVENLFIETDRIGRTPFRKGNPLFSGKSIGLRNMITTDLQALGGGRVRGHLERSGGSSLVSYARFGGLVLGSQKQDDPFCFK